MDKMFSSDTTWVSSYKDVENSDEAKVPEVAENFMNLMLTMTGKVYPVNKIFLFTFLFMLRSVQVRG